MPGGVDKLLPGSLPRWAVVLLPIATALLLRAALGYRPFPAIDDFAYYPIALHHLDPRLFARDALVAGNVMHVPAWPLFVKMFGNRLAEGLWLVTLLLSVGTVAAVFRLMRALGVPGLLLPLAVLLSFCVRVEGLGRAAYDGAFGSSFHTQWLAVCLLLWSYDAFVRLRPRTAGALLGFACLGHPVVAAHGAVVLALASPWTGAGAARRLLLTALVSAVVSLPATLPLVQSLFTPAASADAGRAVADGILFRTPHEYDLSDVPFQYWLLIGLTLLAGLCGAVLLAGLLPSPALRGMAGLLFGHGALLLVTVAAHGPHPLAGLPQESLLLYALHLTRTTALPLVLAAALAAAGLEAALDRALPHGLSWQALYAALVVAVVTLVLADVRWTPLVAALACTGMAIVVVRHQPHLLRAGVASLGVLAAAGFAGFAAAEPRAATPPAEEAGLYAWVREHTAADALFVVPPGMQGFRTFTRRSVYVDFKIFVVGPNPGLMDEWRRRMELVAAPDRLAREQRGWLAVPQWDRSYAIANGPERAAALLRQTGADYLVWDAAGLAVPPFLPDAPATASEAVERAYANGRFTVWRLR